MPLTEKHRAYWRRTLSVTSILLAIWFVATFVVAFFARELNQLDFIGPLGFYMGAQGSLIIYVLIIVYYAHHQNKLDDELGAQEARE